MPVRSAQSYTGHAVDGFPLGGRCKTLDVGASWVEMLGGWDTDLILMRIPQGSRRVIAHSSTVDIAGTVATVDQSRSSWIFDPGVWQLCVDRDRKAGARTYLAIDPADGSDDSGTAAVLILEAASL